MRVTLTVTGGPHQGDIYEFREHDAFIVGRSTDAQFRLPFKDKSLSRVHFMVEVNPPRCRLMDMASTNGTFVNNRKITTIDLEDGDVIRGGMTTIAVQIAPGPSEVSCEVPGAQNLATTLLMQPAESAPVRFRIERELGRGGMGIVYLGHRKSDGEAVALKSITPSLADTGGATARFLREASILRQLDHPNIVRFQEIGAEAGRLYFIMDYVPGVDAFSLLKAQGAPLSPSRAVALIDQVMAGLDYAHSRGVVHRDIKPSNILIAEQGGREVVKLADFGLARLYHNSPLSGLTLTGHIAGSSNFMAPEQITDFRSCRPAADIYSAGASLYYLLTGRTIFDFPAAVRGQLLMILQADPIPIRSRRPELSEALAALVHRALARDPSRRFPSAAAMRKALARTLANEA